MKNPQSKNALMLLARILMSGIFLWAGYGKLVDIAGYAAFSGFPEWQITVAGLVEVAGGLLLLLGGCVHIGASLLIVYLVVISAIVHLPLTDDANNTVHFLKNLNIMGGLIYVLLLGGGKYQVYKCKCDE